MKSILDKGFKYVPAASTDIRKTFERVRREQKAKSKDQPIRLEDRRRKRG